MAAEPTRIHIDGASRGNPGPAAWAYVISRPEQPALEHAENLSPTTNNVAEYTALVRALTAASELGLRDLIIFSDSELLVKQMKGEYRVKNADLKELYDAAQALARQFQAVQLNHVPRAQNARADALCNLVLDGKWPAEHAATLRNTASDTNPKPSAKSVKSTEKPVAVSDQRVRPDALACLETAAQAWADQGVAHLPPAQVWEQLWSLLEEADLLKRPRKKS